ncbi:MAG: hypothetical protein R3C68_18765 [Myxococcota bacterium]
MDHPAAVRPGDTIWIEGGTYKGYITNSRGLISFLKGTADKPIIVRAVPGVRVTIDMNDGDPSTGEFFTPAGDHTWYWGLEITSSNPGARILSAPGSSPSGHNRDGGVYSYGGTPEVGDHNRLINLVIHDLSGTGYGWQHGVGGELYGTLIYNNGWVSSDRAHGHAIYAQNSGESEKRIVDNVTFNMFMDNCDIYGSSTATLSNFHIEGNTFFNSGAGQGEGFNRGTELLVGGNAPATNIRVIANYTYSQAAGGGVARLGYNSSANNGLVLHDNYFAGTARFPVPFSNLDSKGNRVIGSVSGDYVPSSGLSLQHSDTGTKVFVRPNQYEAGRANIVVYNWDNASSVPVDLSEVLKAGSSYRIMHVYDFFGTPVKQGTYDGGLISLPMNPMPAPRPIGTGFGQCVGDGGKWCLKEPTTLPREFSAFVVLSDGCGSLPPKPVTPLCDPSVDGDCSYFYAEAEAQAMTAPMTALNDALASGGTYVTTQKAEEGDVVFTVDIPKAGDYIIWARVLAPSSLADSFYVSANGGAEDIYDAAENTWSNAWQWTRVNGRNGGAAFSLNPRLFDFEAGANTITFRGREVGAGLDVILVTNDMMFQPDGLPCQDGVLQQGKCSTGCTPPQRFAAMVSTTIATGISMRPTQIATLIRARRRRKFAMMVLTTIVKGISMRRTRTANLIRCVHRAMLW